MLVWGQLACSALNASPECTHVIVNEACVHMSQASTGGVLDSYYSQQGAHV